MYTNAIGANTWADKFSVLPDDDIFVIILKSLTDQTATL